MSLKLRLMAGLAGLSLILSVPSAFAQTYEPGRGILLPNRTSNTPGVFPLNNNNGTTIIQRGQITRQPNTGAPVVVNPAPARSGNNNGSADSQRMTDAYAAHLYTGVCSQEYRERIAPKTEPNLNQQKLWADIQTSCKCMSQQLLSTVGASGLADYVMYNYASDSQNAPSAEKATYLQSGQSGQIDALILNGGLQQKCGFIK